MLHDESRHRGFDRPALRRRKQRERVCTLLFEMAKNPGQPRRFFPGRGVRDDGKEGIHGFNEQRRFVVEVLVERRTADAGFARELPHAQPGIVAVEHERVERRNDRFPAFSDTPLRVSTAFSHSPATLIDMQRNRGGAFASILIGVTILMFLALLMHPAAGGSHGMSGQELLARLYEARSHLGGMHGAAIAFELVALACILAFCGLLGFDHPPVAFAAVAFCAATAGICVAASFDGFLIPAFAAPHLSLGDGAPLDMQAAIAAGAVIIQYATKFAIVLTAIAMLLLSLEPVVMREMRAVAISGIVLSVAQVAALVAFGVLTPHNVAFSALPILIWQLGLGLSWRAYPASSA